MWLRNVCFNMGIFQVYVSSAKVISVGNLKLGGSGKTPFSLFLIELFKSDYENIAYLSRGYGRNTKGLVSLNGSETPNAVGDEALMVKQKQKALNVVVSASRVAGAKFLEKRGVGLIVLDDAFQHRFLDREINILLTEYNDLFYKDWVVPMGGLREWKCAANRASICVVTKCPKNLSQASAKLIKIKLFKRGVHSVYFSSLMYDQPLNLFNKSQLSEGVELTALAGLANNNTFFEAVDSRFKLSRSISLSDHAVIGVKQIKKILNKVGKGILICTEKDGVKLSQFQEIFEKKNIELFVLPVRAYLLFDEERIFKQELKKYLKT